MAELLEIAAFRCGKPPKMLAKWWDLPPTVGAILEET
jgi:hypothetical protein